jgi:hypothetical protein
MPGKPAKEAEFNLPGLYVHVEDKQGGGAHDGILWGFERFPLAFASGGKTWGIDLRKKRYPMKFTIVLDKFTHEEYARTNTPKVFKSDVTKLDEQGPQAIKIEMNAPLRYRGLILFQANWGPSNARPGDALFSDFAVVHNPSDHWPLISCGIIALGMLIAFTHKLVRYIQAQEALRA